MPALFTKRQIKPVSNEEKTENTANIEEKYNYKDYGKIKLLHKKTGEIQEINMDEYLYNVVSAEMPVDYEDEALKAQAVVARTYTIYKIQNKKHENADICDDSTCCQAWISKDDRFAKWEESKREASWEKIKRCVNDTKGEIIVYENQPISAFFHSNSGGTTELPVNVWGGTGYPYLRVIETSGEEGYNQYSSEAIFNFDEIINKLKTQYSDIQIDFSNQDDIKILELTDSGRVKTVKFGNHEISGVEARKIFGLKSTNFEIIKKENQIKFVVKGYGHGVGMSQTGADSMAKNGSNYKDIINHFYSGIEIKDLNSL